MMFKKQIAKKAIMIRTQKMVSLVKNNILSHKSQEKKNLLFHSKSHEKDYFGPISINEKMKESLVQFISLKEHELSKIQSNRHRERWRKRFRNSNVFIAGHMYGARSLGSLISGQVHELPHKKQFFL